MLVILAYFLLYFWNASLMKPADILNGRQASILILGDSNAECAFNDEIIENALNLCESSDAYFYSFLKLQQAVDKHPDIDTVLLSFGPHNIHENGWLMNDSHMYTRFKKYYAFMSSEDHQVLLKGNPKAYVAAHGPIAENTVFNTLQRMRGKDPISTYGGHKSIDRNILEEVREKLEKGEELPFFRLPDNHQLSRYETRYLFKIIRYCQEKNIALYLINPPKRSELLDHEIYGLEMFDSYRQKMLGDIPYIDCSRMELPESAYGDFVHLNKEGAELFSTTLNELGIQGMHRAYGK